MAVVPANTDLANHFKDIAKAYINPSDKWRKITYNNAADVINSFPTQILSSKQLSNIKGFGESTLHDVDEFLRKHNTSRHQEMYENKYSEDSQKRDIVNLFQDVYGIGPENANYFYGLGYRDLNSLYLSNVLNNKQRIGIKYYHELLQRIPRSEIEYFGYMLSQRISTGTVINGQNEPVWYIAGSYRRGEQNSGDIDIIARWITMDQMVNILQNMGFIIETLAYGETKYMGIIRIYPTGIARRIDIRIFRPDEYVYGLLYFTGSEKLNILMRNRANELGASLNEYSLTDTNGRIYPVINEEQIFELLGIVYLTPEQRTRSIAKLDYISPKMITGPSITGKKTNLGFLV
jgi:DNA polymerase lambda